MRVHIHCQQWLQPQGQHCTTGQSHWALLCHAISPSIEGNLLHSRKWYCFINAVPPKILPSVSLHFFLLFHLVSFVDAPPLLPSLPFFSLPFFSLPQENTQNMKQFECGTDQSNQATQSAQHVSSRRTNTKDAPASAKLCIHSILGWMLCVTSVLLA